MEEKVDEWRKKVKNGEFFVNSIDEESFEQITISVNVLKYSGKKEIFKEPAVYEGYERFEEVARILKARYGNALLDMAPTQNSEVYLYGDSLTAADRIAKFRKDFFGTVD